MKEVSSTLIHLAAILYTLSVSGISLPHHPSLAQRDLNLCKLYKLVRDNGGMEKVSQELKWRSLYMQLGLPPLANSSYMIKQAYKKLVDEITNNIEFYTQGL